MRCTRADVMIALYPASCSLGAGHSGKCQLKLDPDHEEHERLKVAAAPFQSGGDWGKWKAWLTEGAPTREDGIQAARQITKWQVALDSSLNTP